MQHRRGERLATSRWLKTWGIGAALAASFAGQGTQAQALAIPGQFAVSPSGAATYSIPIEVPPGVAGLTPNLSLEYNSQAGNGLLGLGWTLGGMSSITRCPRTQAQDGSRGSVSYTTGDRYCLDGQRLMLVSGSYGAVGSGYRTELESHRDIMAYGSAANGPAYFIVRTKSGLTLEYGRAIDARIMVPGTATVATWALNRITDAKGNILLVTHRKDVANGHGYPISISYGNQTVQFEYESRPDPLAAYRGGALSGMAVRLKAIQINSGDAPVRRYGLSYMDGTDESRLNSVSLCSPDDACLPEISFNWSSQGKNFSKYGSGTWHGYQPSGTAGGIGDFNGDGRSDLISHAEHALWEICHSMKTAFGCTYMQAHSGGNANNIIADFNGDGYSDLAGYTGQGGSWHVCLSTGSAFDCSYWDGHAGGAAATIIGDFNGDGRADMAGYTGQGEQWHVCYSVGDGFTCSYQNIVAAAPTDILVGDFNGDGLFDVAHHAGGGQWRVCLSTGTGFQCGTWAGPSAGMGDTMVGDFNGDGNLDVAGYTGNGASWHVCLSTGKAFSCSYQDITPHTADQNVVADFDGDGRSDVAYHAGNGVWKIHRFLGNRFAEAESWIYGPRGNAVNSIVGDFDGNGRADLAYYTGENRRWSIALSNGDGTRITSIRDGFGTRVTVDYRSLADLSGYTKGSGSTYPVVDVQAPIHVVSRSFLNTAGGVNILNYAYGEFRAEQGTGRGGLGFRWTRSTEEKTGVEHYTEYRQDWPFVGRVSLAETRLPGKGNGGLLKRVATSYQQQAGTHASTRFVHADASTETRWDLDGTAYPAVTTTSAYNGWGDATQIKVSTSDGGSVTTVNEYLDADTGRWILGRLKKATVTRVAP